MTSKGKAKSTTKKKAGVPPASKIISTPKTDSTKIQKSSRSDTSSSKSVVHTPDKTDAIDIHPPTQISTYPSPRPSTHTTMAKNPPRPPTETPTPKKKSKTPIRNQKILDSRFCTIW